MRNQFHNIKNRSIGIGILGGVLVVVAIFIFLAVSGSLDPKNALSVSAQGSDWKPYTTYNSCTYYTRITTTSGSGSYGTVSSSCDNFTDLQYGNYTIVIRASTTYVTSG